MDFPYMLVHNGFNDSVHAYCDRCGMTAIFDLWAIDDRLARALKPVWLPSHEIMELIAPCSCGGRFAPDAPARCPSCRKPLSAGIAAGWLEGPTPRFGWRWQRSWPGLYAVILGERVVFDPWKPGEP